MIGKIFCKIGLHNWQGWKYEGPSGRSVEVFKGTCIILDYFKNKCKSCGKLIDHEGVADIDMTTGEKVFPEDKH